MGISRTFYRASRIYRVVPGLMVVSLLALASCETKSWFDPSEMGRYGKSPKLMPIQKNLDTGMEETAEAFPNATDVRPGDLVRTPGDYIIGPNDLLQVSIADLIPGLPEYFKTIRVTDSGNISLPMIDQVKASGLTEAQLETAIGQAYKDKQLLRETRISVVTVEARNRIFTISGAVGLPGQYQILDANFRLMDAMVLARNETSPTGIEYIYILRRLNEGENEEGAHPMVPPMPTSHPAPDIFAPRSQATFGEQVPMLQTQGQQSPTTSPAAGRTVIIEGQPVQVGPGQTAPVTAPPLPMPPMQIPPSQQPATAKDFEFNSLKEPSDMRVIRIPFDQLKAGELKYNVVIRPQDFIYVPQPQVGEYYMGGHVTRTGVYSLTARNITLKQAVIAAGMLDQLAIPRRTQIVRRIGTNKEVFARVDLNRIFSGEDSDIVLKPDDQVMVGTTAYAPFLAAFRSAFRITYGFGFLYDRNYWDPTIP